MIGTRHSYTESKPDSHTESRRITPCVTFETFCITSQQHGRDWRRLDEAIPGKTLVQIKNYFQNYKAKLGLDRLPLPAGAVPSMRRRSRDPDSSGGLTISVGVKR